jgi:hypothetical protein
MPAISNDWNCGGSGTACGDKVRLHPGDYSTDHFKDTDGLYIPSGCAGRFVGPNWPYMFPGWHKVYNSIGYQSITVVCV